MIEKLKPCPFCGGEAVVCKDDRVFTKLLFWEDARIKCTKCNAEVSRSGFWSQHPLEKAKDTWNRRIRP